MGGAAIISSPQRTPTQSFDAAAAETRFAHIAGGKQIPYSDVDNALILRALQRQADVVRLTPVMLPNGTVLAHEVRFGAHAVSDRVRKPPATGMILSGNQISGAPRHRRDVFPVDNLIQWSISTQA